MLDKADNLVLNHIIEQIYMEEDFEKLRLWLLETLQPILPFAAACFYLASRTRDHVLEKGVGVGLSQEALQDYIDNYEDKDYTRWLFMSGRNMVFRESDYFPDTIRKSQDYYKEVYEPNQLYWCAQGNITHGGNFLGVIVFYRTEEEEDFNERELFILELLLPHLANRLQRQLQWEGDAPISRPIFEAQRFADTYGLTPREVETLALLMAGLNSEQICEALSISINTFKKHTAGIYGKLGITRRWELIKFR